MKRVLSIIFLLCVGFTLTNCGKEDSSGGGIYTCASCATVPEAVALYDASQNGIYKGVLTGSTGHFKVDIGNDGSSTCTLYLTFNGTSGTFILGRSGDLFSVSGVLGATGFSFSINIGSDGALGSTSFIFDGEMKNVLRLKELSSGLVKVYEGRFSGGNAGTWNFISREGSGSFGGAFSADDDSDAGIFVGSVSGTNLSTTAWVADSGFAGSASGTISGDNASGTWEVPGISANGSWSGRRTL